MKLITLAALLLLCLPSCVVVTLWKANQQTKPHFSR
mgnify:FL=1